MFSLSLFILRKFHRGEGNRTKYGGGNIAASIDNTSFFLAGLGSLTFFPRKESFTDRLFLELVNGALHCYSVLTRVIQANAAHPELMLRVM